MRFWAFRLFRFSLLALLLVLLPAAGLAQEAGVYELYITEAQSNNDTDWSLGFHDYIEIHNASDRPVMLSQYFLTRDESQPFFCHLPARELAPGGYALLICDVDLLDLRLPKEGCEILTSSPKNLIII